MRTSILIATQSSLAHYLSFSLAINACLLVFLYLFVSFFLFLSNSKSLANWNAQIGVQPSTANAQVHYHSDRNTQSSISVVQVTSAPVAVVAPAPADIVEPQPQLQSFPYNLRPLMSVASLSADEEREVARALAVKNPLEVALRRYPFFHKPEAEDLTCRHLRCLRPKTWLNDQVINCHLALLQKLSSRSLVLQSFFWTQWLSKSGAEASAMVKVQISKHMKLYKVPCQCTLYTTSRVFFPIFLNSLS